MRASKSAFFGLFADFFDIYLPIVALGHADEGRSLQDRYWAGTDRRIGS